MAPRMCCQVCGGGLELQADGRAKCLDCGLFYSASALDALWQAVNAATSEATVQAETAVPEPAESELEFLQREQRRLLAEMQMADGAYGPAQRRRLNTELRKVEKRLAKLEGRKLPFWF